MGYLDRVRSYIRSFWPFTHKGSRDLQPRDILAELIVELEKRKKLGIDDNAFAPNGYTVFLSPFDYEEISPLLSGIREQLKNKLVERIRKNNYKILSTSLSLDIREDSGLQRNQVVVESAYIKEKNITPPAADAAYAPQKQKEFPARLVPVTTADTPDGLAGRSPTPTVSAAGAGTVNPHLTGLRRGFGGKDTAEPALTKIAEEKKTKIADETKAVFEIIDGTGKGEVIRLKEGEYTFGRGKDAVVLINDAEGIVSRVHFKVSVRDGWLRIKDLNSTNGTKVNDTVIDEAELSKGDTITAGKIKLRVA